MKKALLCVFMSVVSLVTYAQDSDKQLFNHLGAGVGIGTNGISIDLATTCTPYVGIRAGINIAPTISPTVSLETNKYYYGDIPQEVQTLVPDKIDVKGDIKLTTGRVLLDIFPGKNTKFHFTVGAYFGGEEIITIYNKQDGVFSPVAEWNKSAAGSAHKIGVELGDYLLTADDNGNVTGAIKVSSFRPYLGIGYGRTIPKKRIGFQADLGVQFWGSPKVYCNGDQLTEEKVGETDNNILKRISELVVYPTISFRLSTRIL